MNANTLALDKSARTLDTDGHMRIASSVISSAVINPYNGSEIPNFEALGLDPNKTYNLLRDPAELKAASESFEGKPLLIRHRPQTASDHERDIVIGTVTNPVWNDPDLLASLIVWDAEGIDAIEDGSLRDLSCGYSYTADMTPGTFKGKKYDGVMRDLSGNHVSLVPDGRVQNAFVADAALLPAPTQSDFAEGGSMERKMSKKTVLSPRAAVMKTALTGKLAHDANLDDVIKMLDKLVAEEEDENKGDEDMDAMDEDETEAEKKDRMYRRGEDKRARDEEKRKEDKSMRKEDMEMDEDETESEKKERMERRAEDKRAHDEDETKEEKKERMERCGEDKSAYDEDETKEEKEERMERRAEDKRARDEEKGMSKAEMKSAMDSAVRTATNAAVSRLNGVRDAERAVRAHVGEIHVAMDSADAVYKYALDKMGVATKGVHASAFPTLLSLVPVPGSASARSPRVAMDASASKGYAERFPNASRLVR